MKHEPVRRGDRRRGSSSAEHTHRSAWRPYVARRARSRFTGAGTHPMRSYRACRGRGLRATRSCRHTLVDQLTLALTVASIILAIGIATLLGLLLGGAALGGMTP
jgi:hypothetical protein